MHLSADAITKRLSDMTDAELAALEARMIAAAPIVLEATAEVSDDAGELPDGEQDGDDCDDECVDDEARNTQRPRWEAGATAAYRHGDSTRRPASNRYCVIPAIDATGAA